MPCLKTLTICVQINHSMRRSFAYKKNPQQIITIQNTKKVQTSRNFFLDTREYYMTFGCNLYHTINKKHHILKKIKTISTINIHYNIRLGEHDNIKHFRA